jgi:hypothetical protein
MSIERNVAAHALKVEAFEAEKTRHADRLAEVDRLRGMLAA